MRKETKMKIKIVLISLWISFIAILGLCFFLKIPEPNNVVKALITFFANCLTLFSVLFLFNSTKFKKEKTNGTKQQL